MKIAHLYSPAELKALSSESRDALEKFAVGLVHTSPEIKKIVQKDPKIRKKVKQLLRAHYTRLKHA